MALASKVAVTTTLSGATGGLTTAIISRWTEGFWPVNTVCNGILAGLVSVTSGCATMPAGAAIVTGFIGGLCFSFFYLFFYFFLKYIIINININK